MTDVLLLPVNMSALVSAFLRDAAQTEVAAVFGDRIYTALPADTGWPALRITEYDTQHHTNRPLYLVTHSLQLDAFGGSKPEAELGLRTVMAAMSERLLGRQTFGAHRAVVSRVAFRGKADRPDETHTPAKPRWLITALVTAHPLP